MNGPVDIASIVAGLNDNIRGLVAELFPAGRFEGPEFTVGSPGGEPGRSMAVHVAPDDRIGVWKDFATGEAGDVLDLVAAALFAGDKKAAFRWARSWLGLDAGDPNAVPTKRRAPPDRKAQARKAEKELVRRRQGAFGLWLACQESLKGTPAECYLRDVRGIDLTRLGRQPRALRFHSELAEPENGELLPALVALITGPDGKPYGVHRTWLARRPDGVWDKAPLEDPRRTLGPYKGGAIRIWRGAPTEGSRAAQGKGLNHAVPGSSVVICEGIEDALSIALACPDRRVVAAASASNIANVGLPETITEVIIFADNDDKPEAIGQVERAVRTHAAAGRRVRIARSTVGKDANDHWRAWLAQEQRKQERGTA